MFKDKLYKQQPIAARILENGIKNNRYAHAYLFTGDAGQIKLDSAIFFAQSLLCEVSEHEFACETCSTCLRVKENNYSDFIFIDGSKTSIKKQDILKIQENFNKTALEKKGKKVYILNQVENATVDALNSLLKFLEEPSDDVVAILIVDQMDRLLPTIISRCQRVPFQRISVKQLVEDNLEHHLDGYLLAHLFRTQEEIDEMLEDEHYQKVRICALEFLERFAKNQNDALFNLMFDLNQDKSFDKVQFHLLMDVFITFFKDCIEGSDCDSEQYQQLLKLYDIRKSSFYLRNCVTCKDLWNRSVNLNLLMDQWCYRMKELR